MNEEKKYRILIVDDDSSNIMALTHILRHEYTILAAKSGLAAISAAEKHLPDVIVLDVLMPEMDGYAVFSALKSSERTQNIPVIFVTGLSGAEDEEKGLALGAADYIAKPFSNAIVKLRIGNQIKILDQYRTIERLSMIDILTNLPNRRSFEEQVIMEWRRALRERETISILLIDVDNFKNYNDTHGHQQGDVALQHVARVLDGSLRRSGDFAARWGGEEFIVLLPNTDSPGALTISEQTRRRVQLEDIPRSDGMKTNVTISVGVNTMVDQHTATVDELISGADKALYTAKNGGRNKVCIYT